MSEHDDTLLDEDLGDEEYDLGNDEEEALLADDYEIERQNSYKGEEETDDILDLGVTDALDDLEGEDENIEFSKSKTDIHNTNDFYKDGDQQEAESTYYKQDENVEYKTEQIHQYEANSACDNINVSNTIGKGDLREKLQKNMQKIYIGNGQGLEDDDCEEAKERRNRFQNERTIVSPKMNNDIPDTLENVVTSELSKSSFRGRGRGRCSRGSKGGRFNPQNSGNYSPRFSGTRTSTFDNQQPSCRPLLLETRLPFLLGVPNYLQNQQIMCQQSNLQVQTFQLFSPNSSLQGSSHFVDNRPQFNPNQFQGPVGPGAVGSRLEYGPRGPIATPLQGPAYNCPPNQPPYLQIQQMPFQGPGTHIQDNHSRHMPPNQGPLLHTNSSGSLLGNPSPMTAGNITPMLTNNQSLPPLQGNSVLPMQPFPRQQTPTQGPPIQNHPNSQIPSQSTFENRAPFQEQHFENRSVYESRPAYPDQVSNNSQFNNNTLSVTQQPCSNIPNVPLPPGHKILINPHFRGTVQATNDAARVWDSVQHQIPVQPQISNNQFNQAPMPYQNQNPYNQPQQNSLQYQQNCQQNKSDDPYAYFSDVWQENKPQKSQSINSSKQYSLDNNYSRESGYSDCGNKYKSDAQWEQRSSYQEEYKGVQQNYRERDLSSRPRNEHVQKSRPPSNVYRADTYDQNHVQKNNSRSITTPIRGINRLQQKRVLDKGLHDTSPKKVKPNNRNLQEVQTVATLNDIIEEKKDEDNDPEMQEYRKKMEEQKRLREKILREKENRRKMAAMEKQNEEVKGESNAAIKFTESVQQEGKPVSVLMGVVKDVLTNKNRPGIGRGPNRPVNIQTAEVTERAPGTRIVRTIQTVQPTDSLDSDQNEKCNSGFVTGPISEKAPVRQLNPQYNTRRVVIQKPLTNSQKVATTIQKTVSNLQKGPISAQNVHLRATQPPLLKKLSNVGQKVISNTQRIATPKVVINTQNNQRVVLQKVLLQSKKAPEVKTNTVKLENMAASTSEAQIRRMCQGIGTIESIHMGEGNATIVFKTQSAAMVFHKKYQRKMLDLSLITVRLVPQTSMNKATTSVAKKS